MEFEDVAEIGSTDMWNAFASVYDLVVEHIQAKTEGEGNDEEYRQYIYEAAMEAVAELNNITDFWDKFNDLE